MAISLTICLFSAAMGIFDTGGFGFGNDDAEGFLDCGGGEVGVTGCWEGDDEFPGAVFAVC